MQRFTELRVWQSAFELTVEVHAALENDDRRHGFALKEQLRRAVVSVGANIAEGSRRATQAEYARFLNIAQGSLAETEHLLLVARAIQLIPEANARELLKRIPPTARMLDALRERILREAAQTRPTGA